MSDKKKLRPASIVLSETERRVRMSAHGLAEQASAYPDPAIGDMAWAAAKKQYALAQELDFFGVNHHLLYNIALDNGVEIYEKEKT